MLYNATTPPTLTSYASVQNLAYVGNLCSNEPPKFVTMVVPRGLDFANLAADAPATPTPWAGSPGVIAVWGNGFTAATAFFEAFAEASWIVRGRQ